MNERLLDFLRKSEVNRLPEEKRKLYQFIIEAEDALAEKAATVDEFFNFVLADSPINMAATHFQMPYDRVVKMLSKIEDELHVKIEHRSRQVKWIDFSEKQNSNKAGEYPTQLFLFINE